MTGVQTCALPIYVFRRPLAHVAAAAAGLFLVGALVGCAAYSHFNGGGGEAEEPVPVATEAEPGKDDGETSDLEKRIAALRKRLGEEKNSHGKTRGELEDLTGKYDDLERDHTALQTDYDGLERDHTALQTKYNTLEKEYNDLLNKYNALLGSNKTTKKDLETAKERLTQAKKNLEMAKVPETKAAERKEAKTYSELAATIAYGTRGGVRLLRAGTSDNKLINQIKKYMGDNNITSADIDHFELKGYAGDARIAVMRARYGEFVAARGWKQAGIDPSIKTEFSGSTKLDSENGNGKLEFYVHLKTK